MCEVNERKPLININRCPLINLLNLKELYVTLSCYNPSRVHIEYDFVKVLSLLTTTNNIYDSPKIDHL